MNEENEYTLLIEEIQNSKLDSDQFIKLLMVQELRNISRHLYNIYISLMEVLKK